MRAVGNGGREKRKDLTISLVCWLITMMLLLVARIDCRADNLAPDHLPRVGGAGREREAAHSDTTHSLPITFMASGSASAVRFRCCCCCCKSGKLQPRTVLYSNIA